MRTLTPSSVASNASISTSSSSSSTWLRGRGPGGRRLVESWSDARGAIGGPGLMVSRDVAGADRRIAGRGAGVGGLGDVLLEEGARAPEGAGRALLRGGPF